MGVLLQVNYNYIYFIIGADHLEEWKVEWLLYGFVSTNYSQVLL